MNTYPVIEITQVIKKYPVGEMAVTALTNINLEVRKGEFVAIMGASGSGKSTLMNIIGCLDSPTTGSYHLDGEDTRLMSRNEYAAIRSEKIGFVFQGFNLLSRTSAAENVELPLLYNRKIQQKNTRVKALSALERVGLSDRAHHQPNQLSGGQQQRVAIARAIVNNPKLIVADEPTGNLDSLTAVEIFRLFQELNNEGITIVMVTHEREYSAFAKRVVSLKDGRIISDTQVNSRLDAKQELLSMAGIENFQAAAGV